MLDLFLLLPLDSPKRPSPPPALVAPLHPEEVLLREARNLRHQQRWFEAAALYRRYLAHQANGAQAAEARFWLAATLEQDQRWDEASEAYSNFLDHHAGHPTLAQEATLNRLRCWGIRQGQYPGATPGLLAALDDPRLEVRVAAGLQLAKVGDRRAVPALQMGMTLPAYADASSLQLIALGAKPASPERHPSPRFLVIRIEERAAKDTVTIRLSLALARALGNYLSNEQMKQMRAKGWDLEHLTEKAQELPKGSPLLTVEDGESRISVSVE